MIIVCFLDIPQHKQYIIQEFVKSIFQVPPTLLCARLFVTPNTSGITPGRDVKKTAKTSRTLNIGDFTWGVYVCRPACRYLCSPRFRSDPDSAGHGLALIPCNLHLSPTSADDLRHLLLIIAILVPVDQTTNKTPSENRFWNRMHRA